MRKVLVILVSLLTHPALATTYTTSSFLNGESTPGNKAFGPIFFPAPSGPLSSFGSFNGIIVTDGTFGQLSSQNIVDFQIGAFNGIGDADISSPVRGGTGTVTISGNAFLLRRAACTLILTALQLRSFCLSATRLTSAKECLFLFECRRRRLFGWSF
ncbi:hypothetical protein ACF1BQ_014630 [Bradyrhizobium sp. RDT10]